MLIALDSVPDVILCIQEDGAGCHLEDLVNRLIVRLVHRIGIRSMYKRPEDVVDAIYAVFYKFDTDISVTRIAPLHIRVRRHIHRHITRGMVVGSIFLPHRCATLGERLPKANGDVRNIRSHFATAEYNAQAAVVFLSEIKDNDALPFHDASILAPQEVLSGICREQKRLVCNGLRLQHDSLREKIFFCSRFCIVFHNIASSCSYKDQHYRIRFFFIIALNR